MGQEGSYEFFSSVDEGDEDSIDSNTTTKSTFKDLDLECNRRTLRTRNKRVNYNEIDDEDY